MRLRDLSAPGRRNPDASDDSEKRCEEIPVILKECRIGMILEGTDNVYFSSEVSRFREVEQTRAYFAAVGIGLAETAETKESFTINFVS